MYLLNKRKNNSSSLTVSRTVIKESSKSDSLLITPLLCIITMTALCCSASIFADSFRLFERTYIGGFAVSVYKPGYFWITAIIGGIAICFANGMKKYSVRITSALLAVAVIYFGLNYKAVANGFIHALNKIVYSIMAVQGKSMDTYYLTSYDSVNASRELQLFCLAVFWGLCFLAALGVVKYCNPTILAVCIAMYTAPPLAYFTFVGEVRFIIASVCCLIVLAVRISGYRGYYEEPKVKKITKSFVLRGRKVSNTAFQQALAVILSAAVISGIIPIFYDTAKYERNDDVEKLSEDLLNTFQNIGTGVFSPASSGVLNNGQLYGIGNLKYTGETMFREKSDKNLINRPIYLRSYTAGLYDGKRWSEIPKKTYRSYSDMWNLFSADGFYTQFMSSRLIDLYSPDRNIYNIEIINENIDNRIFLTTPEMIQAESDLYSIKTNYDNAFRTDRFTGLSSYSFSTDYSAYGYSVYAEEPDGSTSITDILKNGDFSPIFNISIYLTDTVTNEQKASISDFFDKERQYRQFVVENYTSYPDNLDDIIPIDEIADADALYDMSKTTVANEYAYSYDDGGDYYINEYGQWQYYSDGSAVQDNSDAVYNISVSEYYEKAISDVKRYLHSAAEYTLSPGQTPYGEDFINYFLNENHKGYCVHFATAATLMLRRLGIPARYVEGYYISVADQWNTDADGYVSIPDSRAHAWTEIYYPLYGWVVADFTPSYSEGGNVPAENDSWKDSSDTDTSESDTDSSTDTQTDSDSSDTESVTDTDTSSEMSAPSDTDSEPTVKNNKASAAVKRTLQIVFCVIIVLLLWLAVRFAVLKIRRKVFNSDNTAFAVKSIYSASLRWLALIHLKPNAHEGEQEFAKRIYRKLPLNNQKDFIIFTQTALSSRFAKCSPDRSQVNKMLSILDELIDGVYNSQPKLRKFIIKYFLFLH